MNRYPLWKYILILIILIFGTIYALPNLYGSDPALQVSASRSAEVSELTKFDVEAALEKAGMEYKDIEVGVNKLLIRFNNEEDQLRSQEIVKEALGKGYVVALNLAPSTPAWLRIFNAEPMFLGLDLRGGVHFLMEVDMEAAVRKAEERYVSDIRTLLREDKVRYRTITRDNEGGLLLRFRDAGERTRGMDLIEDEFPDLNLTVPEQEGDDIALQATLKEAAITETKRFALQQNITTLRKRVNELGVAEPVIQQQGQNRIVVQLPGVQDTAQAKIILGATGRGSRSTGRPRWPGAGRVETVLPAGWPTGVAQERNYADR